jgi:predicted flap endonuclease-1-like 5' DNA nuclease
MTKINKVVGVTEVLRSTLKREGITTVSKFLQEAATPHARKHLSDKTGISEAALLRLANQADFLRIQGVSGYKAKLLEESGVPTMKRLAQINPERLYKAMKTANAREKIVLRVPGQMQVVRWVKTAKMIEKRVK